MKGYLLETWLVWDSYSNIYNPRFMYTALEFMGYENQTTIINSLN